MDRVTDRVIVTCVWNPFDPLVSRETRLLEPGKTIAEYVEIFFPDAIRDGYDLAISINGVVANTEEVLPLQVKEGLSLAFCLVPRGGGAKNVARVVAMIALVALAVYTGGATAGALGLTEGSFAAGMVSGIVAGAIVVVGGMVINAILPYQSPTMESVEGSPTYGWEQGTNFLYEAGALPILYGKRRVTPPVIARHIESVAGENNQYLSVLMALCEGALETIPSNDGDALRNNIRINKVMASNYSGVTAEARRGMNTEAEGQALIQDFNATYTDTAVGIKLTDNVGWITRTTQGNAVETIGVNFSCPGGLGRANSNGGLDTVNLRIQVEYKKQGDVDWTRWQDYNAYPITVTTGRWSKGYYYEFVNWIEVEAGSGTPGDHYENEPATWTLAIGGYDGDGSFVQTGLWHWIAGQTVSGVGTVNQDHLAFSAATTSALRKGWKQTVPAGTYDIRVRLEDAYQTGAGVMADCYWDFYTEAVPDDFIYPNTALLAIRALATNQLSGSFPTIDIEIDRGNITLPTFGSKPSSNPAWACVDLLTNTRYGAGVPIAKIDTIAFQAWADFCALNSYTCNLYIDQTISVRQALNMISQLGRGTVIQLGSRFTVIVDKAEGTPVQRFLFNVGNVVQDSFKEQWLSQDDRANAIEVEYYDADLNYERTALALYADDFDTTDLEIKQASIVLYGCTSRAMAIKHGKFLLNCNRYLTLTAQWDCDIDALACFPGDIVEVQHDIPQWGVGGRVVSSTANSVTLDRPVTIGAGTWHVRVKHQDDDTFEEKTITDGAGTYTTLNISGTWTKNPAQYALYSVGLINFVVKLFRILRISRANDLRRRITAIEYYEPVYSDSATVPAPTPFPDLVFVSNLKAAEIYKEGSIAGVALSWTGYATPFRIFVKRAGETTYRFLGEALGNSFESWGFDTGVAYTFLVTPASSPSGADGATVTITIQGHASLPTIADPVFVDMRCTYTDKIQLVWEPIDDTLLGFFEVRTDLNWGTADANLIYQGKATTFTMKPTGASYTFYIKSHDTFSNYSAGYDSITLTQTVQAPVFVSIDSTKFGRVRIEWEPLNDEYYDVVEVWRSETNDRSTATLIGAIHGNVFSDTSVGIATQYYYWLRTKSIFGTYSAWDTGDTAGHSAMTATINTADLADAVITSMKLAPNITPPEIVDELPTLPDSRYPIGKLVFYTVDMKLYRNRPYGYDAGSTAPPSSGGGGETWSDNFDRADGPLGDSWVGWGDAGPLWITNYTVQRSTSGAGCGAIWGNTPTANQFGQVVVCSLQDAGIILRAQVSSYKSGYNVEVCSGTDGQWISLAVGSTNGNFSLVGSWGSPGFNAGDTLYSSVSGTYFTVKKNTTIVGTATNGLYSDGLLGLYLSGGATRVDSWMCGEGADVGSGGGYAPSSWYDNFNRADGDIGANWIAWSDRGLLKIDANMCARSGASGSAGMIWGANTPADNQWARITANSVQTVGVGVRVQPTSLRNGYNVEFTATTGYLVVQSESNAVVLGVWSVSHVPGDQIYCSVSGTYFQVWQNSTCIGTATNNLFSSGLTGLYLSGGTVRADDFRGGDL